MIRIGVTGHRILADVERVEDGVRQALRRIADAFPGEPWTAVSSLAEGADQLVVQHILARAGSRLVVPLPLPTEDYLLDFGSSGSRERFRQLLARAAEVVELPAAQSRPQAYAAAGVYVVDHCEVLIALWDGQGGQGEGGTASIVARARGCGLPLAWVHVGNRKPGTVEPTSLGAEQGQVTLENL